MIDIEIRGIKQLIAKFEKAGKGDFNDQMNLWLEAMGIEFLDVVQDEIIRQQILDTRGLLSSFKKGNKDNVWIFQGKAITLTLEVGTILEYASYINDGYPLVTANKPHRVLKDGTLARWVPGVWTGDSFEYIRGSQEGMLLKEKFIPGRPYFEDAESIFRILFNASLDKKIQQWLDRYFD